jgi:hypothetical protein
VNTTRISSTVGVGAAADFTTAVSSAIPTLGVQVVDAWNELDHVADHLLDPAAPPARSINMRQEHCRAARTVDLTLDEAEKQFLCEYPIQGLAVAPAARTSCSRSKTARTTIPGVPYQACRPDLRAGVGCVICVDDLNASSFARTSIPTSRVPFTAHARRATW